MAELTRLRLEYNSAKSQLKCYQHQLAALELRMAADTSTAIYSNLSAMAEDARDTSVALTGSAHSLMSAGSSSSLSLLSRVPDTGREPAQRGADLGSKNPARLSYASSSNTVSSGSSSVSGSRLNVQSNTAVQRELRLQLLHEKEQLLQECKLFLSHAKDPVQVS